MPRPTPSPGKRTSPTQRAKTASAKPIGDVDPRWLLKTGALTILAAVICGYLTLCLLFYQGQWQLILHPKRPTTSRPPVVDSQNKEAELVHFAPDESAVPQLIGWWIPAPPGSRYSQTTILLLPSGDGSLADDSALLTALHSLGINIFAFDYRGYGQSAASHPNQLRMTQDADSAWQYLNISRHIPAEQIVLYGTGVGASLATHLAASHADSPALILDAPHGDLLNAALHDPRSKLVPVRLLFHERFPLAEPLSTLHTPKLLLSRTASRDEAFRTAADPKRTVELAAPSQALYQQSLTRFLDEYVTPAPIPQLVPSPAPSATNPR
jgi:pimeloyl-ACP methyl ester carboxylesterase